MSKKPRLEALMEVSLGSPVKQLRAVPVALGASAPRAFLLAYGADFGVDPWVEMFFYPNDTLKLAVVSETGDVLWRRDLGPGVVPGAWFCPVLAFDLDGDGADEVWFVNNLDPEHPLGLSHYRLERLDVRDGRTTGQWRWPDLGGAQSLSHTFRNFIVGGRARGEPVLVTCQGTYGPMFFQAYRPDMSMRWERSIAASEPGARGSHMSPITDMDGDGVEELMWGERCIELDKGTELFCADRDTWRSHSDVVIPVRDLDSGRFFLYTCREGDPAAAPRVCLYDDHGQRVWGKVEAGHIDMGWVARLGEERRQVSMAIRIGHKAAGPSGLSHSGLEELCFDTLTGEEVRLPFETYRTLPVDINGDGWHELLSGEDVGNAVVLDRHGKLLGTLGGRAACLAKLLDHPGEQVLCHYDDGTVRIWADRNAQDSPPARSRYDHPLYEANRRLFANGYNLTALTGL